MMLEPDPKLRPSAEALLALPALRQTRTWSTLWCSAAEAWHHGRALWQVSPGVGWAPAPALSVPRALASCVTPPFFLQALVALLCWLWNGLAHPARWLQPPGLPTTPPSSPPCSVLDGSLCGSWEDESMGWVVQEDPRPQPSLIFAASSGSHLMQRTVPLLLYDPWAPWEPRYNNRLGPETLCGSWAWRSFDLGTQMLC